MALTKAGQSIITDMTAIREVFLATHSWKVLTTRLSLHMMEELQEAVVP